MTTAAEPPPLRVVFMGTAEISCASLNRLAATPPFQVVAVVTQPDKPKGRELKLTPPPVKVLAEKLHLPVRQPERARAADFLADLRSLAPDLIIVAAYGQILPPDVLAVPRLGCVNVHTSLLPKYRGAAPIQRALADGETETGVTLMQMDAGLDTGPMLAACHTPIRPEDDARTLHDRLAQLGAELLIATLPAYAAGQIPPQPQPATGVSYAAKIKKEDGRIDWRQPATVVWNRLRAFTPWPGAFTFLPGEPKPSLLKIWRAEVASGHAQPGRILRASPEGIIVACGEHALRILELQREGGKRLPAGAFLSGFPLQPGWQLENPNFGGTSSTSPHF